MQPSFFQKLLIIEPILLLPFFQILLVWESETILTKVRFEADELGIKIYEFDCMLQSDPE